MILITRCGERWPVADDAAAYPDVRCVSVFRWNQRSIEPTPTCSLCRLLICSGKTGLGVGFLSCFCKNRQDLEVPRSLRGIGGLLLESWTGRTALYAAQRTAKYFVANPSTDGVSV